MHAVRRRVAGDQRANVVVRKPLGQAPLQDALPAAPDTGDNNDGAITALVCGAQEALERSAATILSVTVQIEGRADVKVAAAHALFIATMLRRRRGLGARHRRSRNAFGRR